MHERRVRLIHQLAINPQPLNAVPRSLAQDEEGNTNLAAELLQENVVAAHATVTIHERKVDAELCIRRSLERS